jgi:RNA polymerase sigma-70 factor (ECF subfamily)
LAFTLVDHRSVDCKKPEKPLRKPPGGVAYPDEQASESCLSYGNDLVQSTTCRSTVELSTLTDDELIRAALDGDDRAYDTLAERYRERLLTMVQGFVGCPVWAEDVVQDTLFRAYQKLGSFRGQSSFYTWLYRIAINLSRSQSRRRCDTLTLPHELDVAETAVHVATESPTRGIERDEERRHVRFALGRLDERHRVILILREFDGCDYRTIADILQVKMGTVRSRLARARAQLREELSPYIEPAGKPRRPPSYPLASLGANRDRSTIL